MGTQERWTAIAALGVLLSASTTAALERVTSETGAYTVSYPGGAWDYDEASADAALARCLAHDGARLVFTKLSLPPQHVLAHSGGRWARAAFEACLRALPGARLDGPRTYAEEHPVPA